MKLFGRWNGKNNKIYVHLFIVVWCIKVEYNSTKDNVDNVCLGEKWKHVVHFSRNMLAKTPGAENMSTIIVLEGDS